MAKYHISKNGEPAICTAKVQCRLASESEHFATYEDAYEASVEKLAEEYGDFATYNPTVIRKRTLMQRWIRYGTRRIHM